VYFFFTLPYDELLVIFYLKDEESKLYTGDGSVDFKGRPVLKQNTGNWKACPFILGKPFHFTYVTNIYLFSKIELICDMKHRQ